MGLLTVVCQAICVLYVMQSCTERKIALTSVTNWFLRLMLGGCIIKMLYNDYESIISKRAIYFCGFSQEDVNPWDVLDYCINGFRQILTFIAFIAINFYIFTIDKEGQEEVLDQIKDFTAFFVIVEIDNFLVGYSDIKMDDLNL